MGEYLGFAGLTPVGGKPASILLLTAGLVVPATTIAVGRVKITVNLSRVKVGDVLLTQLLAPLPGNLTLENALVSIAGAVDVYLQNTVLLAAGNGLTVPVKFLVFR